MCLQKLLRFQDCRTNAKVCMKGWQHENSIAQRLFVGLLDINDVNNISTPYTHTQKYI